MGVTSCSAPLTSCSKERKRFKTPITNVTFRQGTYRKTILCVFLFQPNDLLSHRQCSFKGRYFVKWMEPTINGTKLQADDPYLGKEASSDLASSMHHKYVNKTPDGIFLSPSLWRKRIWRHNLHKSPICIYVCKWSDKRNRIEKRVICFLYLSSMWRVWTWWLSTIWHCTIINATFRNQYDKKLV